MKSTKTFLVGCLITVAFVGGYALAQDGKTVSVGGRSASSDVIELNGKIYVSLSDIAKGFDRTVVKRGDNYDLQPVLQGQRIAAITPKAMDKDALMGAVGETLNASQSSLTVLQVVRGAKYVSAITGKTFDAKPDTQIVAVVCRFKNGLRKSRRYDLVQFKAGKTALVGTDGNNYAPGDWDRKDSLPTVSALGTIDFAVVFYLPVGASANEFVYQVRPNDFDSTMREDIFRVSLNEGKPSGSPDAQ